MSPLTDNDATPRPDYHPAVKQVLEHFTFQHLPPHLRAVSEGCARLADEMSAVLAGEELVVGLRKLLEAKDCFVRAMVVILKNRPRTALETQFDTMLRLFPDGCPYCPSKLPPDPRDGKCGMCGAQVASST